MYIIKKDKHFKKRGGYAHVIYVKCNSCSQLLMYYQKDGPGWLKRCYLDRIISPENLAELQHNSKIRSIQDLGDLVCDCANVIGKPMKHKDGRLAFKMLRGSFTRRISRAKSC